MPNLFPSLLVREFLVWQAGETEARVGNADAAAVISHNFGCDID
jgi:hypothetical protein